MVRLAVAGVWILGQAVSSASLAQDRIWPSAPFRGQAVEVPPCTCRAPGTTVDVGGETCLVTPEGKRRARCVMAGNNTSWQTTSETCPAVTQLTQ